MQRSASLHRDTAKHCVRIAWSTAREYLRESRGDNRRGVTGNNAERFRTLQPRIRRKNHRIPRLESVQLIAVREAKSSQAEPESMSYTGSSELQLHAGEQNAHAFATADTCSVDFDPGMVASRPSRRSRPASIVSCPTSQSSSRIFLRFATDPSHWILMCRPFESARADGSLYALPRGRGATCPLAADDPGSRADTCDDAVCACHT